MNENFKNDELSFDELEDIVGGYTAKVQLMRVTCSYCDAICTVDVQKSSYVCPKCRKTNYIVG